jgi:hypothetical protein
LPIHQFDTDGKARLFRRIAAVLPPAGRFVPRATSSFRTIRLTSLATLTPEYDTPSTTDEQPQWLSAAGLRARLVWSQRDLAVLLGEGDPNSKSGELWPLVVAQGLRPLAAETAGFSPLAGVTGTGLAVSVSDG